MAVEPSRVCSPLNHHALDMSPQMIPLAQTAHAIYYISHFT